MPLAQSSSGRSALLGTDHTSPCDLSRTDEIRGTVPRLQGNKSAEIGGTPRSGAGGNRTPVRQVVGTPATTIPDSATHSCGTGGSAEQAQLPGLSPMSAVFAGCQRSFPAVHPHFCCRAVRIWPRAPFPVTMTLYYLTRSGGESELLIGGSFGVPVFRV